MAVQRHKLVEAFAEAFAGSNNQYTQLQGSDPRDTSIFLDQLEAQKAFGELNITTITLDQADLSQIQSDVSKTDVLILDNIVDTGIDNIRTLIDRLSYDNKVVYTSSSRETTDDTDIFEVGGVSFREYADSEGHPVDVSGLLAGAGDIESLNELKESYLRIGDSAHHFDDPESRESDYLSKRSIIESKLFKKEVEQFREFLSTLALSLGSLYKEDGIAKTMNISRRKVRKYTELLLEAGIVRAVAPYVVNTQTELSRHVKLYFADLSFPAMILGESYAHGELRDRILENFILLELDRKIGKTHDIYFYRKKSGAEVSFVLLEHVTDRLTPITVTGRSSQITPQSLRNFIEEYHDRIDHAMILNHDQALQATQGDVPLLILPHVAI